MVFLVIKTFHFSADIGKRPVRLKFFFVIFKMLIFIFQYINDYRYILIFVMKS